MPPIDERTTRFDLELPAEANTLKNDVARLRDSFGKLDTNAAKLDANGKLEETQIPDSVARLNTAGLLKDDQLPLKVPLLDNAGKLPQSTIPDDARMNIMNAASEVLMLDLKATLGDVCNITQSPYKQYLLVKPDPTQRDSWRELPDKAVTSVNGRTGTITVAEAGENADITGLTALNGPLRLGGDASGAYDAVTLRQLQAASGGIGGANMSGVMNNFIGAVEWWQGTRAKLPAGYVAADGVVLNRADYPDLWAAVSSNMLLSIDDAGWLNPGGIKFLHRGKYSTGDGSTTFRVPDLNGVQADSLSRIFLAGSNGSSADWAVDAVAGIAIPQAAPNITGGISPMFWGGTAAMSSGAFYAASVPNANVAGNQGTANVMGMATAGFDASKSTTAGAASTYGKLGGVLAPNHIGGIWIIRANGSFTASGTSFSVINSDAVTPDPKTIVSGGELHTEYWAAGVRHTRGFIRADYLGGPRRLRIGIQADDAASSYASFDINSDSSVDFRGSLKTPDNIVAGGVISIRGNDYPAINITNPSMSSRLGSNLLIEVHGDQPYVCVRATEGVNGGQALINFPKTSKGQFATEATCDIRYKRDVENYDGQQSLDNIDAMELKTYIFTDDEKNRVRRGVIAQQLESIDPEYVKDVYQQTAQGEDTTIKVLDNNALMLDMLAAIKVLSARVKELEGKA